MLATNLQTNTSIFLISKRKKRIEFSDKKYKKNKTKKKKDRDNNTVA